MGYTTGGGSAVVGGGAAGTLALTGPVDSTLWGILALLLIASGVVMYVIGRRRKQRDMVMSGAI